jgi:hypothetical protein
MLLASAMNLDARPTGTGTIGTHQYLWSKEKFMATFDVSRMAQSVLQHASNLLYQLMAHRFRLSIFPGNISTRRKIFFLVLPQLGRWRSCSLICRMGAWMCASS